MDLPVVWNVHDLRAKRVIVRGGLNVPVKDGVVVNQFRLQKILPTLKYLHSEGAVTLLIGHIGRDPKETLQPIYEALRSHVPLSFHPDITAPEAKNAIEAAKEGDVLLFENIRQYEGEKTNDPELAKVLASLAELYVDDAFSAAHRAHMSIVGLPALLPSYAGMQFEKEVTSLSKALTPTSPSLFILGGAKFDTKLPILKATIERYDHVFIGGALANDFLRAQGHPIGLSLVSDETEGIDELLTSENLVLPTDVIAVKENGMKAIRSVAEVEDDEKILDIGPNSTRALAELVKPASFVLWNGPLGLYEAGFGASTEAIAEMVAAHDNTSIVGGGDTIAAIAAKGLEEQFTFLSTGGGAMLDFLADGTLPGVDALLSAKKHD